MVNIMSKRLRQVLVGCLVLSLFSAIIPLTVSASETTYETNSWITIQYIGSAPGMDEYRGWDPKTGFQTRERLEELGLDDIADVLEKEGHLSLIKPRPRQKVLEKSRKKARAFKAKSGKTE